MDTEFVGWKVVTNHKSTYMIGNLKGYLDEKINENQYSEHSEDYSIECPYCSTDAHLSDSSYNGKEYHKKKLYVHKDGKYGKCFRCTRVFINVSKFIDDYVDCGVFSEDDINFNISRMNNDTWNLDLFKSLPDHNTAGVNYLINKRHKYMEKLYKILHFRFLAENPVIPFFYKKKLIYYQVRYITNFSLDTPYFSPTVEHKPPYIIERNENKKFVICEGVFDAIACLILYPDRTPFAVLGSSITEYQLCFLRSYVPEDIIVSMDTTELSNTVASNIRLSVNYAPVSVIRSGGEDPEERMKRLFHV